MTKVTMTLRRIEDLKTPAFGSKQVRCSECQKRCWISPEARIFMLAHQASPLCEQCFESLLHDDPPEALDLLLIQ